MLNSRIRLLAAALIGAVGAIADPALDPRLPSLREAAIRSALRGWRGNPGSGRLRSKHRQSMAQQKRCAIKRRNRQRHKARIQRK